MTCKLCILLVSFAPLLLAPKTCGAGSSQERMHTIKVKTELVELRVSVADRQGHPIGNLAVEDFELRLDGKPRSIDFFSFTRVEDSEKPSGIPASGTRQKSMRARLTGAPVRTVVLFIDTLHLSVSSLALTKQALRKFVDERLTDQDMVALATTAGSLGIAEQFTRNRELLRYGIEKISPGPIMRQSYFTPYLAACIQRGDSEALRIGAALLRLEEGITGRERACG